MNIFSNHLQRVGVFSGVFYESPWYIAHGLWIFFCFTKQDVWFINASYNSTVPLCMKHRDFVVGFELLCHTPWIPVQNCFALE
jgi:hypothetical protein